MNKGTEQVISAAESIFLEVFFKRWRTWKNIMHVMLQKTVEHVRLLHICMQWNAKNTFSSKMNLTLATAHPVWNSLNVALAMCVHHLALSCLYLPVDVRSRLSEPRYRFRHGGQINISRHHISCKTLFCYKLFYWRPSVVETLVERLHKTWYGYLIIFFGFCGEMWVGHVFVTFISYYMAWLLEIFGSFAL